MTELIVPRQTFMIECSFSFGVAELLNGPRKAGGLFSQPGVYNFHLDTWYFQGKQDHGVSVYKDSILSTYCFIFENPDLERTAREGYVKDCSVLAVRVDPANVSRVIDAGVFTCWFNTSPIDMTYDARYQVSSDRQDLIKDGVSDEWSTNLATLVSQFLRKSWVPTNAQWVQRTFGGSVVELASKLTDSDTFVRTRYDNKKCKLGPGDIDWVLLPEQEQEQDGEKEQSDGPVVKRVLKAYVDALDILTPKEQCERFINMYGTVSARKPKTKQTADLIVPKAVDNRTFLDGLITFLEDSVMDRLFNSPAPRNFHLDIWSLEGEQSHPIIVLKDPNMNHCCFVFDNPDYPAAAGLHYLTVLSVETTDDFSVKAAGFFRIRFDADPNCEEKQRYLVAKERCDLVEPYEPNMFSSSLPTFVSQFIRHHWMLANPSFVEDECKRLGIDKGDADNLMSVFTRRNLDGQMYVLGPGSMGWQLATDIDLKKYSRLYDAVQDFDKEPPEILKEEKMEETMEAPDPQEYTGPAEKSSVEPPEFSMLQLSNLIEGPDPTKETYKLHVCDRQRHTVEKQKETFEFTISLEIEGHHVIAAMVWIDIMHIGAPYIYVKMFAGKNSDLLVTEGNCANEKYISGRDYTKIRDFIFDGIANVVKEVYK